jgi:hypothetical protein
VPVMSARSAPAASPAVGERVIQDSLSVELGAQR